MLRLTAAGQQKKEGPPSSAVAHATRSPAQPEPTTLTRPRRPVDLGSNLNLTPGPIKSTNPGCERSSSSGNASLLAFYRDPTSRRRDSGPSLSLAESSLAGPRRGPRDAMSQWDPGTGERRPRSVPVPGNLKSGTGPRRGSAVPDSGQMGDGVPGTGSVPVPGPGPGQIGDRPRDGPGTRL
jgi:hypothetical protein